MTQSAIDPVRIADTPRPAIGQLETLPRVDLMPPEIGAASAFRRIQIGCGAVVLAAVVVVGSLWFQGHHEVSKRQSELTAATTTQDDVQQQVTALAPVAATYAKTSNAQAAMAQTLGAEVQWSSQLNALGIKIPTNVWLTSVAVTAPTGTTTTGAQPPVATITFQGYAVSRDAVAAWLDSIGTIKGFTDPYYSSSTEQAIGKTVVVDFTSTVNVTAAAESGRYTNANGS